MMTRTGKRRGWSSGLARWLLFFCVLTAGWFLLACAGEEAPSSNTLIVAQANLPDVQGFVGTHTRIVWVQDVGDGKDFYGQGDQLRLMGFDALDGRGERPILSEVGHYAKPVMTPKGDRVLFSDRNTGKIFIVNWDGSELREVTQGRTLTVWMDWDKDREWVYAGRNQGKKEREQGLVVRFPLDDPSHVERVWDTTLVNENNFLVSADGTRASVNTPHGMGIADLTTGQWEKFGEGCWTALAPDNSYVLWIFEGSHRRVSIFDPRADERRSVVVNGAPGIDGHRVFHPRWSNHPRFLAVTGPFREGIGGGGEDVEIYLGRFNADITAVEDWLRITRNDHADFYPDVWIAPDPVLRVAPQEHGTGPGADVGESRGREQWPGDAQGLVFIWDNRAAKNEVVSTEDKKPRLFSVEAKGLARYGRFLDMDIKKGHFLVEESAAEQLLAELSQAQEWTLEVLITPDASLPEQSGVILALVDEDAEFFMALRQERSELVLQRPGSPRDDALRSKPLVLGTLHSGQPNHIVVSVNKDAVRAYLNGTLSAITPSTSDSLPRAGRGVFFGDYPQQSMPWQGAIEAVAIHARAVGPDEALRGYSLMQARLAKRHEAPRAVVTARLTETSTLPTVQSIAPYRRALVVNTYAVEKVLEGELAGVAEEEEILVAHWAILDEQVLPRATRVLGETLTMRLQHVDDRPELEGEWLSMDISDVLLPLYFDAES